MKFQLWHNLPKKNEKNWNCFQRLFFVCETENHVKIEINTFFKTNDDHHTSQVLKKIRLFRAASKSLNPFFTFFYTNKALGVCPFDCVWFYLLRRDHTMVQRQGMYVYRANTTYAPLQWRTHLNLLKMLHLWTLTNLGVVSHRCCQCCGDCGWNPNRPCRGGI